MTVYIIPTSPDPFYSQRTQLDGVNYLLSFAYNQREDRIYFSLADDEENPIVSGIKVLANFPMLFRHRWDPRVPPGELFAVTTTSDTSPPRLGELGEGLRCQFKYYDGAEIAALRPPPPPPQIPITIWVAVRITVTPPNIPDGVYYSAVQYAVANGLSAAFGSSSSFSAHDVPVFGGSLGTITGVSIGQLPQPAGPTSIASTQIQLGQNQILAFDPSRVSVVAV